jgi:hypothetical protein
MVIRDLPGMSAWFHFENLRQCGQHVLAIPSAKYACSGSLLMFSNRSTAIDGLSGVAKAGWSQQEALSTLAARRPAFISPRAHRLKAISTSSPNLALSIVSEIQTPADSAIPSCPNVNAVAEHVVFVEYDVSEGPLVHLSRCEVRDHVNHQKSDRWRSYRSTEPCNN